MPFAPSGARLSAGVRASRSRLAALAAVLLVVGLAPAASSASPAEGVTPPVGDWVTVSSGGFHICALDTEGAAWCWGRDDVGQLGNGDLGGDRGAPVRVDTSGDRPDAYAAIDAGDSHTCGLDLDGAAWCWGYDDTGQIGDGAATTVNPPSPVRVDTTDVLPDTWTAISAGGGHTCALATDGTAWCWGADGDGQLGDGAGLTRQDSPVAVDTAGALPDTWSSISAGGTATCGIASAVAYCWGSDATGELGNGAVGGTQASPSAVDTTDGLPDTWSAISAGYAFACGLDVAGAAWCWGTDQFGQLGDGAELVDAKDVPSPVAGGRTWLAITAGYGHACGTTSTQSLCWGLDGSGQLGDGSSLADQASPVAVTYDGGGAVYLPVISAGSSHTCGVVSGTTWCWGSDELGQVGDGLGGPLAVTAPVRVGSSVTVVGWRAVAAGYEHTCALDTDGRAWCWGDDSGGQLGNGDLVSTRQDAPVLVDTAGALPDTYVSIAAGAGHTCAIAADGSAWCWGADAFGQLGDGGSATTRTSPWPVDATGGVPTAWTAVTAGTHHTCAIAADASAWCWGDGEMGQRGDGTSVSAGQSPVAVGGGLTYTALAAGYEMTCGLTEVGAVACWGADDRDQLGNGATLGDGSLCRASNTPCAVSPVLVDTSGGRPDAWTALSAGSQHVCAIARSGPLWCWGNNAFGQLGNGTDFGTSASPAAIVAPDGVTAWTALTTAAYSTCATTPDGTAWCWGYDGNAELGNGAPTTVQANPNLVVGGGTYAALSGGFGHVCAISTTGPLACWGSDLTGQLGNGTARREPTVRPSPVTVPFAGNVSKATCKSGTSMSFVFSIAARSASAAPYLDLVIQPAGGGATAHVRSLRTASTSATFRGSFTVPRPLAALRFVVRDTDNRFLESVTVACS